MLINCESCDFVFFVSVGLSTMSALVDFTGDGDIYPSRLFPVGSHADVYLPPFKRPRFSLPYVFGSFEFEQRRHISMDLLPDECLYEIFRRLPGKKEISSCACVSRRWLMVLTTMSSYEVIPPCNGEGKVENDGFLTRSLEGGKATDVRLAAIAVGTSLRGGLGKLLIRGSHPSRGVSDLGLSAIARCCPALRFLSLWNVPLLSDTSLLEISLRCPSLEKLDLCDCPTISNEGLAAIARNCPELSSISIESCPAITNDGLQAIGKLCANLSSVSIRDCPAIGDLGVSSLISSASSVISRVKLQSLSITDFSLAAIGHYGKKIASLTFSGLHRVSEKGFWAMGKAQGLQELVSLSINSCRGITDVSFGAITDGCRNLKQLFLRDCVMLSDKGLLSAKFLESLQLEDCHRITQEGIHGALANSCSTLKALSLVKCMGIKDEQDGISTISSPCSSLRSLSIRNCPGFGSTTLSAIGELCPQLQYLDLSGLCGIAGAALLPLVEGSKAGLVKVNTSGCFNLTDDIVSSLTSRHGGTLEVLNLDGCRKITDASMAAIAKNCLFLRDLSVSKCAITDSGVALLSFPGRLNLQILSLSGCLEVTSSSLPYLKKMGRTLVGLNLQGCGMISSSAVQILVESLWRCDILS